MTGRPHYYESLHVASEGQPGSLPSPAFLAMTPTPRRRSGVRSRGRVPSARAWPLGAEQPSPPPPPPRRQIGHIHVVTIKERLQTFLDGPGGIALETFNVFLSILLVVISVVDSYDKVWLKTSSWYDILEISSTIFFTIDFGLHLYASEDSVKFIVSPMGIIDLITIIPVYITFFLRSLDVSILPIMRIMRVFRMLSVLRLYRVLQSYRGFDYELGVLVFLIFTVIFVAAGTLQILDEEYYKDNGLDELQFHQAVYFVFVTVSTVGFGDITPKTALSQMFVIVIICVVVTVIPRQINRLVELSRLQHAYMHNYAIRKSGASSGGHVVVTGHISHESVSSFLSEFYRIRHGKVNMDVVILADQIPSERLLGILRNARYRRRTTFLKGSLLNDKDAKRAHIDSAAAVFILADKKNVKHADAADALTILQALAVDKAKFRTKYKTSIRRSHLRCFLQVLSPQRTRGLRTITGVEVALNTPRLRTAILARSIVCPGAIATILNLICSTSEQLFDSVKSSSIPWIAEYAHGLQHQLFPVILPCDFDGMLFERAAWKLYKHFNIIMLAVYDKHATTNGGKRIRLCPFGHELSENELAFLIAMSASDAQHAVNSLVEVERQLRCPSSMDLRSAHRPGRRKSSSPPTLVYSSETVLDRQSMVRSRTPSIQLCSDDESEAGALKIEIQSQDAQCSTASHQLRLLLESDNERALRTSPLLLPPFLPKPNSFTASKNGDWTLSPKQLRHLKNHIIICGPLVHGHQIARYLDDMYRNEKGIAASSGGHPTILLLVKRLPTEHEVLNLPTPFPPNVYVEKGVSQNVEDLLHVRAYVARAVLMIPGNWKYHVDELREETLDEVNEHLLDYQVIMSTLSLRTVQDLYRQHIRQTTEGGISWPERPTLSCSVVKWHESIAYFSHKSSSSDHSSEGIDPEDVRLRANSGSIKFRELWLQQQQTNSKMASLTTSVAQELLLSEFPQGPSPMFSPSYAAGEVFVDGVLDTLLCQSFFNPYVIDLIRALAGDYYRFEHHTHATPQTFVSSMMKHFQPPRRRSRISSTDPEDPSRATNLKFSDRQDCAKEDSVNDGPDNDGDTTDDTEDLRRDSNEEGLGDFVFPILATATIASELEGQPFATIFQRALHQNILVLAIYRRSNDPRRGNAQSYVYTCPQNAPSTTVEVGDVLHVLTTHNASTTCVL